MWIIDGIEGWQNKILNAISSNIQCFQLYRFSGLRGRFSQLYNVNPC